MGLFIWLSRFWQIQREDKWRPQEIRRAVINQLFLKALCGYHLKDSLTKRSEPMTVKTGINSGSQACQMLFVDDVLRLILLKLDLPGTIYSQGIKVKSGQRLSWRSHGPLCPLAGLGIDKSVYFIKKMLWDVSWDYTVRPWLCHLLGMLDMLWCWRWQTVKEEKRFLPPKTALS